jgi:predicted 2-oxoglutarate/Fe(II)-dependent dioxygenase YbiX
VVTSHRGMVMPCDVDDGYFGIHCSLLHVKLVANSVIVLVFVSSLITVCSLTKLLLRNSCFSIVFWTESCVNQTVAMILLFLHGA